MADPTVVTTRADLRRLLDAMPAPGMVPTMGALHAGHEALIARSAAENPVTVVTVFVNPTQFGDPSDFERYPRILDRDAAAAGAAGATVVFAPTGDQVYPPGFATSVAVGGIGDRWEGAARPGHFGGVATVVAVLFGLVRPVRAYFGEKDYQQLQVIRRMHADLGLSGAVVGCPTVREPDGLARSSRNERLPPEARSAARVVPAALATMRDLVLGGQRDAALLRREGMHAMSVPGVEIDYLAVVDGKTLEPVNTAGAGSRILVAAIVGGVRLIDNLDPFDPENPWPS